MSLSEGEELIGTSRKEENPPIMNSALVVLKAIRLVTAGSGKTSADGAMYPRRAGGVVWGAAAYLVE
jgi:hypothetical protein